MNRKHYRNYVRGKDGIQSALRLYYALQAISILIVDDQCASGCYIVTIETDDEQHEKYLADAQYQEVA